jgi:ribonuclease-3 family protein
MVKGQMMQCKEGSAVNAQHPVPVKLGNEGAGVLTIGSMKRFLGLLGISEKEARSLRMANPLVLAFVGDAVYEHYVRMAVIHRTKGGLHQLHRQSTRYVKATAQAYVVKNLENFLTDEERDMIRKGRNQKGHSAPKNTQAADYRLATGFETLIGWLGLQEDPRRLEEVVAKAIEIIDQCSVEPTGAMAGLKEGQR